MAWDATELLAWAGIIVLFAAGMAGAVLPAVPGVPAVLAGFLVYGWAFGFGGLGIWFWACQLFLAAVILFADYAIGAYGTRRFGGTNRGAIGGVAGLVVGPFVIPVAGLLIGPFLGAVAGELLGGARPQDAVKAGVGTVLGLLGSTVMKVIVQAAMIALFVTWIIW